MSLKHGGQLSMIAKQYQRPESQWLDLSTGVAPYSYPIGDIPESVYKDLPSVSKPIVKAAQQYYHTEHCWPLAGSQQLIEKLPHLWEAEQQHKFNKSKAQCEFKRHVYLPKSGYKEHQYAWENAGYHLHFYQQALPIKIHENAVVVVINPNNPRADIFSVEQLSALQCLCERKGALLIIDEAFADIFPVEFSFTGKLKNKANKTMLENVIILRSIGKFFGLAGLRIGFVCSNQYWCEKIKQAIGPWSINGVALYITARALVDKNWQQMQLRRLTQQSKKQLILLDKYLSSISIASNALFITVFLEQAELHYHQLCIQGLYVRLTDEKDALRFGIANEQQLIALEAILSRVNQINYLKGDLGELPN